MGYLYIEEGICPVSGEFLKGKQELDTVNCVHCQKVIKVVIKGINKAYETDYSCHRCRAPICKACARVMERLKECPGPFKARIEASIKKGRLDEQFQYRYQSVVR